MRSSRLPRLTWRTAGNVALVVFAVACGLECGVAVAQTQAPAELLERQAALQRRVDDLSARFRELADDLADQEPEQAARITAALERLGDLRFKQRMQQASEQIAAGDHDSAIELQRQMVADLARLQRFLRTGRDEAEKADDIRDELVEALQASLASQKQINQETTTVVARRPADGMWRRAERLAFGKLAQQQRDSAGKLAPYVERLPESSSWQVVASLLQQLVTAQTEIATSLAATQIDETLTARQHEVESSLEELVKQLRPQTKRGRSEPMPDAPMPAASDDEGGAEDLPVSLALQLLRGEQSRLLDATRQMNDRLRTAPTAPELPAALAQLAARQKELDRRVRELLAKQAEP